MPTRKHDKVRVLLKNGMARVVKRTPFTVQLLYDTTDHTQDITLGVDAGSKHIGLSATTESKELYAAEVEVRNDIVNLLSTRREMRRARRNRKTRYRKPRFDNRRRSDGWLAPSVRAKVDAHLKVIEDVHRRLPITKIVIEVAAFDLQRLKADMEGLKKPKGKDYQEGDRLGFWNVREYVLWRDNHTCQNCKGKSKDKVLNVHHIESRKIGGDAPDNLVTLCETCHGGHHKGTVSLPEALTRRGTSFRDATFMGIMRWACYNELERVYPNVKMTYGYITKNVRIKNGLEKSHATDARCISGNPLASPAEEYFYVRKIRCHNRQIHRMSIGKGGYRKRNQAEYLVRGFRLFDKVSYKQEECFITGRRATGSFMLKKLDGTTITAGISSRKLTFLETRKHYITERRLCNSSQG